MKLQKKMICVCFFIAGLVLFREWTAYQQLNNIKENKLNYFEATPKLSKLSKNYYLFGTHTEALYLLFSYKLGDKKTINPKHKLLRDIESIELLYSPKHQKIKTI